MADLRENEICVICLESYKDQVMLSCGHSFCRICITSALDVQEESRVYTCPVCKAEHQRHHLLVVNEKLHGALTYFHASPPQRSAIFCTDCIKFRVPAVKSCLQCEISMCEEHMTGHKRFLDHMLTPPLANFEDMRCTIHGELLKYYCLGDGACICLSCLLDGPHNGHDVEDLDQALMNKQERLNNAFEGQFLKRETVNKRIRNLQHHKRRVEEKAIEEQKRLDAVFDTIRRGLIYLERKGMSIISNQVEKIGHSLCIQIEDLKAQREELSKKMSHTEKLCNMTDQISVLQAPELDSEDDLEDEKPFVPLDHALLSITLYRSIRHIFYYVLSQSKFCIEELPDLILNEDTADELVAVTMDFKLAFISEQYNVRPHFPGRFKDFSQVMSVQSFSKGTCYWEVEISHCRLVDIGMCYPSMPREGWESVIGRNVFSWGIRLDFDDYYACHDSYIDDLQAVPERDFVKIGIYLDYESGILSFYQLTDPIKRFYTFVANFTEPLHAVLGIDDEAWVRFLN
ncbi:E3 ubiquitin/ISG15 ligase TRIM25-like [Hyperolius riggenbachi]|uniref:E3 ubiquitin/ISG15 ligase TRIM25-like n=1 Tax=Hyperolius riggenbachi TaxID=752182 RepID=UPI0035A29BE0